MRNTRAVKFVPPEQLVHAARNDPADENETAMPYLPGIEINEAASRKVLSLNPVY